MTRPNVVPIFDAADRAIRDELYKWTYDVPEELRLALSRAVVKRLQEGSMLNYDRPWELDDAFADVLAVNYPAPARSPSTESETPA